MSETELLNSSSLFVTFGIISASVAIVGLPLLPVCSVSSEYLKLTLGDYARILIFFGRLNRVVVCFFFAFLALKCGFITR